MNRLLTLSLAILVIFVFTGCLAEREPLIPQYNSGMKKNKEWNDYNNYAKLNNQPILDFAATTLFFKFGEGTVNNYNTFLTKDMRVTIQTKWHNCEIEDLFEFKYYLPDGRLFHYDYFSAKKSNDKWTIGRHIYLNNMPASEIQGQWKVKVIANGKDVVTKYFNIVNEKKVNKTIPTTTIGFLPYWNSKDSTWNHSKLAPIYLSQELLKRNNKVNIVPTLLLRKDIGNPQLSYQSFESQVIEDLKDNNGILSEILNKHKMDYLVLGKVESSWDGNTQNTDLETYIVDVNSKILINKIETNNKLFSSAFSVKTKGIHPKRVTLYKELYKDLEPDLLKLIK